jgi:hypothetical protein
MSVEKVALISAGGRAKGSDAARQMAGDSLRGV